MRGLVDRQHDIGLFGYHLQADRAFRQQRMLRRDPETPPRTEQRFGGPVRVEDVGRQEDRDVLAVREQAFLNRLAVQLKQLNIEHGQAAFHLLKVIGKKIADYGVGRRDGKAPLEIVRGDAWARRLRQLVEHVIGVKEKRLPGRRQFHALLRPGEQVRADRALDLPYRRGDGRLGNREVQRGLGT
jgi:hypothetical protein